MNFNQQSINYQKVAEAIEYVCENQCSHLDLKEIAQYVSLNPDNFQRLFIDWAGVSPEKYFEYCTIMPAKKILENENQISLFDVANEVELSATGRLHDLFVKIEEMTPDEFKNKGENLRINYSFEQSPFGKVIIGSTEKGVCYFGFSDEDSTALMELKSRFRNADFIEKKEDFQKDILRSFTSNWDEKYPFKLHLKGTAFQLKVWEALLSIPAGKLNTYQEIAHSIDQPKASRAVGTAIGSNPIAFLIPCHRVIQTSGGLGGYMWGTIRKTALIAMEAVQRAESSVDIVG